MLVDADLRAGAEVDWTGRYRGATPAVVRPADAAEVASVLLACAASGVAVVPQGGNTGLVGGSVPLHGEVVLSTRRLDTLGPVDPLAAQVTVGAGATLEAVGGHVAPHGLVPGIDLGARATATIGGMVATNAGGNQHLRHGSMRARVAGVEAVLANGSIVSRLHGLEKDNTGYDLTGLLCGSEGTLGVVTAVRLRLAPAPKDLVTCLVALTSVDAAMAALMTFRQAGTVLEAAELMLPEGLELVARQLGVTVPLDVRQGVGALLLLEWAGGMAGGEAVALVEGVVDVAVAEDPGPRRALWRLREGHTEAVGALGTPHKLDVTLPLHAVAGFIAEVGAVVERVAGGARCVIWGHAADGNLHVNVVGPDPADERVDDAVLRLVAHRGGSISAEHGIGGAKRRWLHLARSEAEIAALRAIKAALDPGGLLNPHVLFP